MTKRSLQNILVTGGCGFIGSNFIRYLFADPAFKGNVINIDKLTYAGNIHNLEDISNTYQGSRYFFIHDDICNASRLEEIFDSYAVDTVVHFAAESHVDRSIYGPAEFIQTNIIGTFTLLEAARKAWADVSDKLFYHVSTDEVYGSLGDDGCFYEDTPYDPRSPYSASKASADHLVMSYFHTYGIPVIISNCSNNYGPYQFPEKLIPLMIINMLEEKPLPVYGDGKNVRDWLHVDDHCNAAWLLLQNGVSGRKYNIGGRNEIDNLSMVNMLCKAMARHMSRDVDHYSRLITFVKDRPGHDWRYAVNCDRIMEELGWKQWIDFETGLRKTIEWYCSNREWVDSVVSGEYREWVKLHY